MRWIDKELRPLGTTGILVVSALVCCLSAHGAERRDHLIADFAQQGELQNWKLGNSGPKSKIELVPGPEKTTAARVTCVHEAGMGYYQANGTPYMPFRRAFDGQIAVKTGATRMSFWHKGDGVQVVFSEKDRGDVYYAKIGTSPDWRCVFVCFADLALGWNQDGTGKGSFELARMDAIWLAVAPAPEKPKCFAVADFKLEYSEDDLSPLVFIGSEKPQQLDLYPRTLKLPINRTQPLLIVVRNEKLCGLKDVEIELSVEGRGDLSPHSDHGGKHLAKSLRLVTDEEGKAQARLHPTKTVGESCLITARIAGTSSVAAACARFTTAPEFHKVTLGPDGFFVRPDGRRIVPLGGLFLPWWGEVIDGKVHNLAWQKTLIAADEAEQRGWFAYLEEHGVNCLRGYWSQPVKLGPGGAEIPGTLYLDGKVHEPVAAALERTLALGGEYGIGSTLTIANCARPFIAPGHRRADWGDKSRRRVMYEADEFLREFVPRVMFNPNVWAYELTNEQAPGTFAWSERFIQTIKELDEVTPVMVSHSGGGLQRADPLAWMNNTSIDIYQPHLYPNETRISPEIDAGLVQEIHYNAMQGPKPWLLGEAGWWHIDPPVIRCHTRDNLWFALLNRACGAFLWGPEHVTPFEMPSKIVPLVDWKALNDARAMVGVAVPRDLSKATFFRSAEGKQALEVMARYARWGLQNGVTVDFVLDAEPYDLRRSALEPFDPPEVQSPFSIGKGYQFKYRMSADGKLVVGYCRNVAKISKFIRTMGNGSKVFAYLRVREPLTADIRWELPVEKYSLTVWDLDTGQKTDIADAGQLGIWRQEQTDHDFVLMWQAYE